MEALREVLSGGKFRVLSLARVSGVKRSLSDFFANNESGAGGLPTSATFCFPLKPTFCFPLKPTVDDSTGCGVAEDWGQSWCFNIKYVAFVIQWESRST